MKQLFLFTIVCLVAAVSCQKEEETSYYQPIDLIGEFYYSYVKGVVTDSVLGTPITGKVLRVPSPCLISDSIENGTYLLIICRRQGGKFSFPYPNVLQIEVYENYYSDSIIENVTLPIGELVDNDTIVVNFEL